MIAKAAVFSLQDSLVVLNPDFKRIHLLNPSASSVYEAFAAGLLPDEIAAEITAVRGDDPHSVRFELDGLIQQWRREGLTADSAIPSAEQKEISEDKPWYKGRVRLKSICGEADFRLHDLIFRVRTEDSGIWQAVLSLYGHLEECSGSCAAEMCFSLYRDDEAYLLVQDGRILCGTGSRDEAVLALASEIAELWHRRRDWLFIAHAAGVFRENSCILLSAKGGSGKTTLAAALIQHGFSFLSDDIIPVLRGSGHAAAHPLCLHIKQGSVDVLRPMYHRLDRLHAYAWGATTLRFLPPPTFRLYPAEKSWPVAQIIFPRYQKGADTLLRPVSPAEAFQYLLEAECILKTPLQPDRVKEMVDWVQQRPVYTLRYSRLDEVVEILKGLPDFF